MLEEEVSYFYDRYNTYKKNVSKDDAAEFAFFDLKNKYRRGLDFKLVILIPELLDYLKKKRPGEKSYFHFGRPNSDISQINAALTQKDI